MRIFRFAMNADANEYDTEEKRLLSIMKGEEIIKPKAEPEPEAEPEIGSGWEYFKKHKRG